MKYIYSFLFFIPFVFVFGKDKAKLSYDGIRKNYENYAENDISAFAFINPYIQKAKKEKNILNFSRHTGMLFSTQNLTAEK